MGDVCTEEIVENNGNKTKDWGDRRGRQNEETREIRWDCSCHCFVIPVKLI